MKCNCKQCGKVFELSEEEIKFYKDKNLELPKRCRECRARNKIETTSKGGVTKYIATAILAAGVAFGSFMWNGMQQTPVENSVSVEDYVPADITTEEALSFRSEKLLEEHYEKHGVEMGFSSAKEYEEAARDVVENSASLHKIEKEDNDDVYYLESTNEFVIVSTDGYIRTYFSPEDGIAYFNRQ